MKYLLALFALLFMLQTTAFSQTPPAPASAPVAVQQHDQDIFDKLAADGYMAAASVPAARAKYGSEVKSESSWTKYLSLINLLKVVAVGLFLIAFAGTIKKIVKGLWSIITMVPTIVYQLVILTATVGGTIMPQTIWASQAFYIALFCAFANLIVIGWIFAMYPALQRWLEKIFSLGIPPAIIACSWLTAYFAGLAYYYDSQVFGFFSAVSFSGIFSFGLFYMPGVLFLDVRKNYMGALAISHIALLAVYAMIASGGLIGPNLKLFAPGIEYYCTIALGVTLLIGASPFYGNPGPWALATFAAIVLAFIAFAIGLKSIGSIIMIFGVLIFLEWLLYASWHGGLIIGTAVTGGVLYFGATILESNGRAILNAISGS